MDFELKDEIITSISLLDNKSTVSMVTLDGYSLKSTLTLEITSMASLCFNTQIYMDTYDNTLFM